jgi:hypothetical protein
VRGSGDYDRKKKDTVVCLAGCAVVLCQFLVLVGNWQFFLLWREIFIMGSGDYDQKKKKIQSSVWRVVLLCQFLVLAGN